jgi:hypothetical protein
MPLNPIALAVKVSDSALCADSAVQNYAVAAAHAAVSLLCPCEGKGIASPSDYTDATKPAEGLVKAMSNYLMQARREAGVDAKDREIVSLKDKLADRERMLGNVESELNRVRSMVTVVLDAESIAATITNGAEYHAHANTRTHAVAAAHAALAILTESQGNKGVALVKEMSKWLEETRKATLLQASRTVADLR